MYTIPVLVALVLLGGYGLVKRLSWAVPRRVIGFNTALLESSLDEILREGGRGSVVYLKSRKGIESLQFHVDEKDQVRQLVLVYPAVEWSHPYFEEIQRDAAAQFPVTHTPAGKPRRDPAIWVWFGSEVSAAAGFAMAVLSSIYGLSPEVDCEMSVAKFPRT
jgi:hypothetical protein